MAGELLNLAAHLGDETVVEFLGGVVAGGLELDLKGGDFDEAGQVASGPHGDDDVGDFHAENFDVFLLQAQAVNVGDFIPGFQGDDQVHAFFGANAADAEHGGDVDDADAADFHVGAGQLGAGAHDVAAVNQGDAGDVVGNEAVAALDEGEDALAFADAAFAADDGADAEDVHHAADFGAARGEEHFEGEGGHVDEFHGDQRGDEDGDLGLFGGAEEEFVGV